MITELFPIHITATKASLVVAPWRVWYLFMRAEELLCFEQIEGVGQRSLPSSL